MSQNCGCDKQTLDQIWGELLEERDKEEKQGIAADTNRELEACLHVIKEERAHCDESGVSNLVVIEVRGGCVVETNGLLDKQRLLIIDWDNIGG